VHIADVAHFLKPGSIADDEAQRRTTSVYLLGRVLPMLPHALCNFLCSLNPNEPKLSFSAFFRLCMVTGNLIDSPKPWFSKTAISSVCRLNYDEVQEMLDGKEIEIPPVYGDHTWEQIRDDIKTLRNVCGKVRRGRFTGGALALQRSKLIFHTRESEDGVPTGYHLENHSASHWIIEELMLLANRVVAEHLYKSAFNEHAVLRHHEQPHEEKTTTLRELLVDRLGLHWKDHSAGAIYRSLVDIRKRYGDTVAQCVEMQVMRSGMKPAEYFVVDEEATTHHFALNFEFYTHFTSPIRRYPDVMVHRCLQATLTGDASECHEDAVQQVTKCNMKKADCRKLSWEMDRVIFCIYLRARKELFYCLGTILELREAGNETHGDTIVVYCSHIGKECQATLRLPQGMDGMNELGLFESGDTLTLPKTSKFVNRGEVHLQWESKDGEQTQSQQLRMLSCVPVVIIPLHSVPIDYRLFFVSPMHPKYDELLSTVPEKARKGFAWRESSEDDGVDVVFDAKAGSPPVSEPADDSDLDMANLHTFD